MNEPKKYTAKEAMHWMIDNPEKVMIDSGDRTYYWLKGDELIFVTSSSVDTGTTICRDFSRFNNTYIRSEYDAWQKHLKQQAEEKPAPDEKEPRVGESLDGYLVRRNKSYTRDEHYDMVQRWIEANFVRREGR